MPIPYVVDVNIVGELRIVRILQQEPSAQLPIHKLGRYFCNNS